MASIILYSVYIIAVIVTDVSGQEGGTCQACNCQLNNVETLNRLIQTNIRSGKLAIIIKLKKVSVIVTIHRLFPQRGGIVVRNSTTKN